MGFKMSVKDRISDYWVCDTLNAVSFKSILECVLQWNNEVINGKETKDWIKKKISFINDRIQEKLTEADLRKKELDEKYPEFRKGLESEDTS